MISEYGHFGTLHYLPDNPDSGYNLGPRRHNKTLIDKTTDLNTRNFLLRMLYKDCY